MIALHRPTVSEDGRHIAIGTTSNELQIIRVVDDTRSTVLFQGRLPKVTPTFLAQASLLRWAPSPRDDNDQEPLPWLLTSDGNRLLVLNTDRLLDFAQNLGFTNSSFIAADYQLGDQFGKVTFADFVFDGGHVLVMLEASDTAMVLSTTRPQRDEIPNVKTSASRSIARSSTHGVIAMLRRVKGQDQLMLLALNEDAVESQSCFNLPTFDAQGSLFCPGQDPILAVWESAAYGMKVHFFSAMGHPLKTLDVTSFGNSTGLEGLGLSQIRWTSCAGGTTLAVADNTKQTLVRFHKDRSVSAEELGILKHPSSIDGTKSIVWQQTGEKVFSLQKSVFEAVQEPAAGGSSSLLELNCDASFLASTVSDNSRTVWIWQPEHSDPHTIITFMDPVRALLWHPKQVGVLVILTSIKTHSVFCWHTETRPPTYCEIPLPSAGSIKFEAAWGSHTIDGRHSFSLSSTKGINYGFMQNREGSVRFHSVLQDSGLHLPEDEDSMDQLTPSKPAQKPHTIHDSDVW